MYDPLASRVTSDLFPPPPLMPQIRPDIRVGFILAPRFTLMAFASFIEGLRHAADEVDFSRQIYCHWTVLAPSMEPVPASCGISVGPNETFQEAIPFDHLVVVGGLVPHCLDIAAETLEYIRKAHREKVTIVGLCTGSFILAQAGLLKQRHCAVDAVHQNQLKGLFPEVISETEQSYVIDDIVTSRGGLAPLSLVLALIESRCGKARARKAMTALQPMRGQDEFDVSHRPYAHLFTSGIRKIELAMEIMEKHIASPLKVSALADQINTSTRELNRIFSKHAGKPPTEVWRDIRLAHAHWLLLNTSKTVTQIALECGFADGAHFSRWFRKTHAESPIECRNRRRQF